MQTAAVTSRLFIGDSSEAGFADPEIVVSYGGLIQHIITSHLVQAVHSREACYRLNNALIHFAERAYTLRDIDALEEISSVLLKLPLDAARIVGLYYHALASQRKGQINEAKPLFETVVDSAPITYRARALQSLGINHHTRYQLDEALRFQLEALRMASDRNAHGLQTTLLAHLEISHVKSDTGDHKGALAILESISPLVQIVSRQNPLYFYFYHNELAVEFGELNRIAEAEAASAIALASPFAPAYPEWAETRRELEMKRASATPSVVAIHRTSEVIPAPRMQPQPCQKPDRMVAFCWLRTKQTSIQIASVATARFRAAANGRTIPNTLDRLGRCIRSRGPPARP